MALYIHLGFESLISIVSFFFFFLATKSYRIDYKKEHFVSITYDQIS